MKPYIKVALLAVFFLVIGGIFAAIYLYNLKPKDLRTVKPDFVLSAVDLNKAFNENEKDATVKYVNKVLEVTGEIIGIKAGDNKVLNIQLKTESDLSSVICTFPSADNVNPFGTGKTVTIRGICSGFLLDVLLNNCALIENFRSATFK